MIREGRSVDILSLCKRLGCSTQPIYLSFSGMDELRRELKTEATKAFSRYLEETFALGKYPPYKCYGMGYIGFAEKEKGLFRFLCFDKGEENQDMVEQTEYSVRFLMERCGISREEALRFHGEMWALVHGIACLIASGQRSFSEEDASAMISDVYLGLLSRIGGKI